MPTQAEIDAAYQQGDVERRLREVETRLAQLMAAGLDRLVQAGYVQFDNVPMRWDNNGIQIATVAGVVPAIRFVEKFTANQDAFNTANIIGHQENTVEDDSQIYFRAINDHNIRAEMGVHSYSSTYGLASITLFDESPSSSKTSMGLEYKQASGATTWWINRARVQFQSDLSPSTITTDVNDYSPTGWNTRSVLRLDGGAASRNITGLESGASTGNSGSGDLVFVLNVGINNLVMKDESTSSIAANRFKLNGDLTLEPDDGVVLWYDGTSSRWRVVGTYNGAAVAAPSTTWALTGDISPSQITANQNDYSPTGLSTASVLRLSSDASRDITGLAGGSDGRILLVFNVGSNNIVLKDESASSTAANRFALNGDITLAADNSVILWYDATSSRWRAV